MKRTIILGAAAFLFAIGSAFVGNGTLNGKFSNIYMQSTASPTQCVVSTCNLTSPNPCDIQSYSVKLNSSLCANPIASFKD